MIEGPHAPRGGGRSEVAVVGARGARMPDGSRQNLPRIHPWGNRLRGARTGCPMSAGDARSPPASRSGREHASVDPLGQPAPAGRRRAATKLPSGQQPPGGRGTGHVDNRGEAVAAEDGPASATVWRARWGREQGLDHGPQLIRHEFVTRVAMDGACHTRTKGANGV
jgi:hypothetical protein